MICSNDAAISVVGMACRYADADSPAALWETAVSQRRAFRRLPAERLRLADYHSADRAACDYIYSQQAAVLEGFEFDRVGFRVAGRTFRVTDTSHWLALDIASRALADAGFEDGEGLPRPTTGVLVGNTLTGEFSRAHLLRLRWPYVRRVLTAALAEEGWSDERLETFTDRLERDYKAPFPPSTEDSLAGGLANTIAGRICNHFDLNGGGYILDGACSSSLLAVVQACSALAAGDLDVAVVGGVDLSLDPFELVGFARTGALAADQMRVYDARSDGFIPGEGCGFVVLMRRQDALADGRTIHSSVRGWGISSDGSGGITRPEPAGQMLALDRAYERAGVGIDQVAYFEGHGTGTRVGDAAELEALSGALRAAGATGIPAALGSIKANIGHTKAASGIVGLIKATLALEHQYLPPVTSCEQPHQELQRTDAVLRVLPLGEQWPAERELLAGVSGMGFGGINAHLVLAGDTTERRSAPAPATLELAQSNQDTELFLLQGEREEIELDLSELATLAPTLSSAELVDLACGLAASLGSGPIRAAVVADRPDRLAAACETLVEWLRDGIEHRLDFELGAFLGQGTDRPKCGLLFPGQGSPPHHSGGTWRQRFPWFTDLYTDHPPENESIASASAAIASSSVAGLRVLERLGLRAEVAIGHSLGEFSALHWAGVLDQDSLLRTVAARGRAMDQSSSDDVGMVSLKTSSEGAEELIKGHQAVVAVWNSAAETVVSGPTPEITGITEKALAQGLDAIRLRVRHAFHSPWIADAAPRLARVLAQESLSPPRRQVVSTVTGEPLAPEEDLRALLVRQVTEPVRFRQALEASSDVDLWIEVGPGRALEQILRRSGTPQAISLDAGSSSLQGLLAVVGSAFAAGAPVAVDALFAGRFHRPFDRRRPRRFLINPCELAPAGRERLRDLQPLTEGDELGQAGEPQLDLSVPPNGELEPLELLKRLVAERSELPLSAVQPEHRLLSDLHLTSLAVGQLIAEASKQLQLPPSATLLESADAPVAELARTLEEQLQKNDPQAHTHPEAHPDGVDNWVRPFTVAWVSRSRPATPPVDCLETASPNEEPIAPWQMVAPTEHPLRETLATALQESQIRGGVVLCLPQDPGEEEVDLLLEASAAALSGEGSPRFVVVQQDGGGGAFARSLHLEAPSVATSVIDLPFDHPRACDWVIDEIRATDDYLEARYDSAGQRREPVLRWLDTRSLDAQQLNTEETALPPALSSSDVLLVTGGGKGIGAECALALARETGTRLVLLGRSDPASDSQLADNLARLPSTGVRWLYLQADVDDAAAVAAAVRRAESDLGPISAIIHAAGVNRPQLLGDLDGQAFRRTLAPKLNGLRHLLAAVEASRLRLLVTFGSIIARTGMRGNADYAVANEWLTTLTESFGRDHPHCRALAVEWSVWADVGMGENLGGLESLKQQGITPISIPHGTAALLRLIQTPLNSVATVVTGRVAETPTLRLERPDLPLLRFLEHPRVHYPGVEMVVEAELSAGSDPYLADHVFDGEPLLPAVMGLEAMCQVAMALTGRHHLPVFENVRFLRPVIGPEEGTRRIRLAALARQDGTVDVTLRSDENGFDVDHFAARCRFEPHDSPQTSGIARSGKLLPVDPALDLYGGVLFQQGRFQRLAGYRWLRATESLAEIVSDGAVKWFGRYLPIDLVLGDPAARDAVIHSIQASIPHATVLPVAVERLEVGVLDAKQPWTVAARERSRDGRTLVYDVDVVASDGTLQERWLGLELRVVNYHRAPSSWALPLLGPYVERRLAELIPGAGASVMVTQTPAAEGEVSRDQVLQHLVTGGHGLPGLSYKLPSNGSAPKVSLAHCGELTLAVIGAQTLSCDLAPVLGRGAEGWRDQLERSWFELSLQIAQDHGEDLEVAGARLWAARQCLEKAGVTCGDTPALASAADDGWLALRSGSFLISTLMTRIRDYEHRLVLAVLGDPQQ